MPIHSFKYQPRLTYVAQLPIVNSDIWTQFLNMLTANKFVFYRKPSTLIWRAFALEIVNFLYHICILNLFVPLTAPISAVHGQRTFIPMLRGSMKIDGNEWHLKASEVINKHNGALWRQSPEWMELPENRYSETSAAAELPFQRSQASI